MNHPHVMVDIETLATSANAVILSIGAVEFGPSGLGETFYEKIDLGSALAAGQVIDASTLQWWTAQSDDARSVLREGGADLSGALLGFKDFAAGRPIWGNGAAFDNATLREAFRLCRLEPWSHRDDMCFRTLKAMASGVPAPERVGAHHNALDDAKTQALHAAKILASLGA